MTNKQFDHFRFALVAHHIGLERLKEGDLESYRTWMRMRNNDMLEVGATKEQLEKWSLGCI